MLSDPVSPGTSGVPAHKVEAASAFADEDSGCVVTRWSQTPCDQATLARAGEPNGAQLTRSGDLCESRANLARRRYTDCKSLYGGSIPPAASRAASWVL